MTVDIAKFTKELYRAADKKGYGKRRCGEYVRKALQAGGANFNGSYPETGKDYGPKLLTLGFHKITVEDPDSFNFMQGDVMVMEPYKGSTAGHVAGRSQKRWASLGFRFRPARFLGWTELPHTKAKICRLPLLSMRSLRRYSHSLVLLRRGTSCRDT